MSSEEIIIALDLPAGSLVNQRVPKKLLVENGAPTATDKRYINEGIEELVWLAALKPTTIGVPNYRDEVREYLEVAVLQLKLRGGSKMGRLVELVHRAIPYPVLLLNEQGTQTVLSAAHKRWSQGEGGKTVIDGEIVNAQCDIEVGTELWSKFCDALKIGRQPRVNLHALYQGWIDTLLAWNVARITGAFTVTSDGEHPNGRTETLREFERLSGEVTRLRAAAKKEKQVAKRVELNLELKRVERHLAITKGRL